MDRRHLLKMFGASGTAAVVPATLKAAEPETPCGHFWIAAWGKEKPFITFDYHGVASMIHPRLSWPRPICQKCGADAVPDWRGE
jgi:hypothetical protein